MPSHRFRKAKANRNRKSVSQPDKLVKISQPELAEEVLGSLKE